MFGSGLDQYPVYEYAVFILVNSVSMEVLEGSNGSLINVVRLVYSLLD